MRHSISFTILLTLALVATQATFGQSGGNGYFNIYNNTSDNIVVSFYTNDGSGWSSNWLSEDLDPGEFANAEFFADTGECGQLFQVGWLGERNEIGELV